MKKPLVGILMGSDSDLETMREAVQVFKTFDVPYEIRVLSAHRSPEETARYARSAQGRGLRVIITGAGGAAHLGGVVASQTTLPVVGVPIETKSLKGLDSLLSTVQMPGGVPVASMAIGKAGAKNAALFAVQILAGGNSKFQGKLAAYKEKLRRDVKERDRKLSRGR